MKKNTINLPLDKIFIAVGSSIGDGKALFLSAEKWLEGRGVSVVQKSQNIISEPYGGVAKNVFTNAVWEIEVNSQQTIDNRQQAESFLELLLECEAVHGRIRQERWGDRTLDLDLLWYKGVVCDTDFLKLPHPEMEKRDFVMKPLLEILGGGVNEE